MSGGAVRTTQTSSTARTRVVSIIALSTLLVVVAASAALAQESQLGGKLRTGDEVLVPADATVEGDLYASGGLVRVEGTVDGDLIVFAGQVQITGTVTGDLMAAGGTLGLDGEVGGDVRAAGGRVAVTGTVGEDLLVAGGQVRLASSGEVGEDLVFGTGQMMLDGAVTGDVLGSAGTYVNRGSIGGTERVTIQEPEDAAAPTVADRVLDTLRHFVSVLLIAALALWLAPGLIEAPTRTLRERPLMSLLGGVVGLIAVAFGVPVLIVIAVLLAVALAFVGLGDLVGLVVLAVVAALVLLALALVLALGFGAPAIVGMTLGDLVIPASAASRRWWSLLVGVLVVVVISALPIVGGWFAFLVALFGFGALLLALAPRDRTPTVDEAAPEPA
jgi:cytoskeletal protein CcmA (bactofilin family)